MSGVTLRDSEMKECAVAPGDSDGDETVNSVTESDELPAAAARGGGAELSDEVPIVKARRRVKMDGPDTDPGPGGPDGSDGGNPATADPNDEADGGDCLKHILIGAAVGIVAMLVAPLVLYALGFTSTGVTAGSMAAYLQKSTTGRGGWFAACQSAGVLGMAISTKLWIGFVVACAAGILSKVWSMPSEKKENR